MQTKKKIMATENFDSGNATCSYISSSLNGDKSTSEILARYDNNNNRVSSPKPVTE